MRLCGTLRLTLEETTNGAIAVERAKHSIEMGNVFDTISLTLRHSYALHYSSTALRESARHILLLVACLSYSFVIVFLFVFIFVLL